MNPSWHDSAIIPALLERLARAEDTTAVRARTAQADPNYPAFHLAPPSGRLNDPNGLFYADGRYQASYQWGPFFPDKPIFWRRASSTNLLHWQDEEITLAPIHAYDSHGCYSGCAFLGDGRGDNSRHLADDQVTYYYTGNVKDAEDTRRPTQAAALATRDGSTTELLDANPLLPTPPAGITGHWRDPQVSRRPDGSLLMLLGAQTDELRGCILAYTSTDGASWDYAGPLTFDSPTFDDYGYMWECPNLITVVDEYSGKPVDVLIFCPQGVAAQPDRYQSIYPVVYVTGALEGTHFHVATEPKDLDYGHEFYAPQIFAGTVPPVMLGWMGNAEQDDQPSLAQEWVHHMTLPRTLHLRGGHLFQAPPKHLATAPGAVIDDPLDPSSWPADNQIRRAVMTVLLPPSGDSQIALVDAADPTARLVISIHSDLLTVDRSATEYPLSPVRRCVMPGEQRGRELQIIIDHSSIEIFIDHGRRVLSSRLYLGTDRYLEVSGDVLSLTARGLDREVEA